jgi:hypothetical protein
MNPIVIRSLGAIAPPRPSAEAGMMDGNAAAQNAPPIVFKKLRRPINDFLFIIFHSSAAGQFVAAYNWNGWFCPCEGRRPTLKN